MEIRDNWCKLKEIYLDYKETDCTFVLSNGDIIGALNFTPGFDHVFKGYVQEIINEYLENVGVSIDNVIYNCVISIFEEPEDTFFAIYSENGNTVIHTGYITDHVCKYDGLVAKYFGLDDDSLQGRSEELPF